MEIPSSIRVFINLGISFLLSKAKFISLSEIILGLRFK